jgi:hypothetical protein
VAAAVLAASIPGSLSAYESELVPEAFARFCVDDATPDA